jgi:hypothetical protein
MTPLLELRVTALFIRNLNIHPRYIFKITGYEYSTQEYDETTDQVVLLYKELDA